MKLTADPLFRFFALGALLLLVYAVAGGLFGGGSERSIDIGAAEVALLAGNFERQWRRPPTEQELRGLVQARVREEVLYREALALGLDDDDVIVRRRMVQKMELLSQDLALMADPTDEELRGFYDDHREDYRLADRITFTQVYFSIDRRGDAAEQDATALLARIQSGEAAVDAGELGDASMLPSDFRHAARPDVERALGERFTTLLFELDGGWHGPLTSPFGIHLVHVVERSEGEVPPYEGLRADLVRDFNLERGEAAKEQLYQGLLSGYEVAIDEEAVARASVGAPDGQAR